MSYKEKAIRAYRTCGGPQVFVVHRGTDTEFSMQYGDGNDLEVSIHIGEGKGIVWVFPYSIFEDENEAESPEAEAEAELMESLERIGNAEFERAFEEAFIKSVMNA